MRKLKAIFYDMDGTLVYFRIDFHRARQKAIEVLEKNGVPKGLFSIKLSSRETVVKARNYMKEKLNYENSKTKEIITQVSNVIAEIEMEAAINAEPVKNIRKLLEFARNMGIMQIICTFNTHKAAQITVQKAGINKYFDAIYGRDDVPMGKTKPNKEHLQVGADKFSLNPEECLMIGDHQVDILAAKAFGCVSIGVKTPKNQFHLDHAKYMVDQSDISEQVIFLLKQKFL